jgi:hypothetical protein
MRKSGAASSLQILAISNTPNEIAEITATGVNFDDHQLRFERDAMLRSISKLAQATSRTGQSTAKDEFVGDLGFAEQRTRAT